MLLADTAVGSTQQVKLSPRVPERLLIGSACGVVALRRAAQAVCGWEILKFCMNRARHRHDLGPSR